MSAISECAAVYHLTPRQSDVARLLIGGLPNKSIARLLCLQTKTVEAHMSRILSKTHTENRTQAAFRLAGCEPPR